MSSDKRKIGFYSFGFENSKGTYFFDPSQFKTILDYVLTLKVDQRMHRDNSRSKAFYIADVTYKTVNQSTIASIIIKSCKYNHSPDLMSSMNGVERKSDKKLIEGEREKTHLLFAIGSNEAFTILEERRSGVNANAIMGYLNVFGKQALGLKKTDLDNTITYGIVPSKTFIESLTHSTRIKCAEVHCTQRILGTEFMNIMEREDEAVKDDVIIKIDAKRTKSIGKPNIKKIYEKIMKGDKSAFRIRVYGADENNNPIVLDSEFIKKSDYVIVELDENRTVVSSSIFTEMNTLLESGENV